MEGGWSHQRGKRLLHSYSGSLWHGPRFPSVGISDDGRVPWTQHRCRRVRTSSNSGSLFFLAYSPLRSVSRPVGPRVTNAGRGLSWNLHGHNNRLEKHSFIPNKIWSPFLTAVLIPSCGWRMNRKHFVASHVDVWLRQKCLLLPVWLWWGGGPTPPTTLALVQERNQPKEPSLSTFKNL